MAPISGTGESENVHVEGGCTGLHLHGTTDATFDGGQFNVENQVVAKGEGCNCPKGVQCLHVTGTLVTNYSASVTIGMPSAPGGLNDCEKAKVESFLQTVLLPHEQDHQTRFKTYDGQTRNPVDVTGCGQAEVLSKVKAIQESENQARKAAARALSGAIDPFVRTVDCSECQKAPDAGAPAKPNAEGGAQRTSSRADTGMEAPPIVEDVLATPGQPLAESARRTLEPGFGQDFSGVRVHDDSRAAESASAVSALAYTVGNHIVFGAGQYSPGTNDGNRLLAHELTHTIQQTGGMQSAVPPVDSAHRLSSEIRSQASRALIQRDVDSDDYKQGYQDGLSGGESNAGPRDGDALTDYGEGYAKGHYELSQQSSTPAPEDQTGPPAPSQGPPPAPADKPSTSASNATSLDQEYNAAVQKPDWQTAAEKLNGFNREDIQTRLAQLNADQVAALYKGAIDNPRVGKDSQVAQMTAPGTAPASTPAPASSTPASTTTPASPPEPGPPQMVQSFWGWVAEGNWPQAAETLNGFNETDIRTLLSRCSPDKVPCTSDQIALIHKGALDNPRVGPKAQVALLTESATPAEEAQDEVAHWDNAQKFHESVSKAITKLGGKFEEQLKGLLEPESVALFLALLALQATPGGWLVDLAVIGIEAYLIGSAVFQGVSLLLDFINGTVNAKSHAQLEKAGGALAGALAILGIGILMALLFDKGKGEPEPAKGPTGEVELKPGEAPSAEKPPSGKEVPPGTPPEPTPHEDPATGLKIVDEAPSADEQRTIKITEDGECEVCASPCEDIRNKYSKQLTENPDLAAKLDDASRLTDVKAQEAAFKQVEQQLADAKAAEDPAKKPDVNPAQSVSILLEDITDGPHGPERPMKDVVARMWKIDPATGKPTPQGRWLSREGAESSVSGLDVPNMIKGKAYSVPIPEGTGEVVRPVGEYPPTSTPKSELYHEEPADRALVVRQGDKIHCFPIGPEHPAYNQPAPMTSASKP